MKNKVSFYIVIILLCLSTAAFSALDLKFTTAISQSPDPGDEGNIITFSVTLTSVGGIANNLKLIGGVDSAQILEKTFTGIADGGTRTQNMNWTAISGTHKVWFELDPEHTCGDSDYNNNRIEKAINVNLSAIVPPDISIHAEPNLTVTDCLIEPSTYKNGDWVTLKFTIKNIGYAPTSSLSLVEYKNYNMMQTFGGRTWGIPPVEAGFTYTYNFNYQVIIPSVIKIAVDSTNLNEESNEKDNSCSVSLKVKINKPKKQNNPYKP